MCEMERLTPNVAVIGSGYWGKNLVRNFHDLSALHTVCDTNLQVLRDVEATYVIRSTIDFNAVIADPGIQGIVIATPAVQHFELARMALLADKDVYVEKPLALHAHQGRTLVDLAASRNRILMVGHILEYHPAVLELKKLIS